MHFAYLIRTMLPCALVFNTTQSFDALNDDANIVVFTHVLSKTPTEAQNLSWVSKYFFSIVNHYNVIKNAVAQRPKIGSSTSWACAMGTSGSKKYITVNKQLMDENNIEKYFETLKKDPYADINFTMIDRCTWTKLTFINFFDDFKTEDTWTQELLKHGYNLHEPGAGRDSSTSPLYDIVSLCHSKHTKDQVRPTALKTIAACFQYNEKLSKEKKIIHGHHLQIQSAIYNAGIAYLACISQHKFDIKKECPRGLHNYLKYVLNPDHSSEFKNSLFTSSTPRFLNTISFLLDTGYDPYAALLDEAVVLQSPFDIINKSPESPFKTACLELFKNHKKTTVIT